MLIFVNVICFLSPFIRETRLSSNMGYIGLLFLVPHVKSSRLVAIKLYVLQFLQKNGSFVWEEPHVPIQIVFHV